jgi:3-keto-disaccharide hydrolase
LSGTAGGTGAELGVRPPSEWANYWLADEDLLNVIMQDMKQLLFSVLALCAAQAVHGQTAVNFDNMQPGSPQARWQTGVTGKGEAKWEIVKDESAPSKPNVLKQSGEGTFVWAVKTDAKIADGFVEVKFKPVGGNEDQAGGIVWRFQDGDNYYVVRANALEDNVVLYKTEKGKRSPLPVKGRMFGYGVDIKVPKGQWGTLRVDFAGPHFAVTFNGRKLFEVEDETFKNAGAVGLWTKADSVTLFDNFSFGQK